MIYDSKVIFIGTFLFSCIFAYIYECKKMRSNSNIFFFLSSILLVFVQISTDSGVDYYNYYDSTLVYSRLSDIQHAYNREPLYSLWCVLVMYIFNNAHIAILGMKLMGIVTFMYALYYLRKDINVFIAVLAICSLYYIQSIYLLRIQIASAFILLSVAFWYKCKSMKKVIIPLIIACGFHFSGYFALIPYLTYFFVFKGNRLTGHVNKILLITIIVFLLCLSRFFFPLLGELMAVSDSFAKFHKYDDNIGTTSTGLFYLFQYAPIFVCMMFAKREINDKGLLVLILIWATLGYSVTNIQLGIFVRLVFIMSPIFVFYVPLMSSYLKKRYIVGFPLSVTMFNILFVAYFLVIFFTTSYQYLNKGNVAELDCYHFVFPTQFFLIQ